MVAGTEINICDTRHERNLEVNYKCRFAQWKNYSEQEFTLKKINIQNNHSDMIVLHNIQTYIYDYVAQVKGSLYLLSLQDF